MVQVFLTCGDVRARVIISTGEDCQEVILS